MRSEFFKQQFNSLLDAFDEEKELELKEWEQSTIYGRVAIELEHALKGGES